MIAGSSINNNNGVNESGDMMMSSGLRYEENGAIAKRRKHGVDIGPDKLHSVIISTTARDAGQGTRTELYSPADSSPTIEFAGHQGERLSLKQILFKIIAILLLLYFFVCSLDTLSNSFRLIAGRAAGEVFQQEKLLSNPIVGVMMGILVTVAVQSSSTSTSIVVSMVASGLFTVKTAIPIVMGANIGTSVTNTIVALTHMSNREDFERAFAGSVLHDMFNLLAVATLLVIESLTSYLEVTTTFILNSFDLTTRKGTDIQALSLITKPFTGLIVQIDKNVIIGWSLDDPKYRNASLLKKWCNKTAKAVATTSTASTLTLADNFTDEITGTSNLQDGNKCKFLFNVFELSDLTSGVILLVLSLLVLCGCLIFLVKVLSTLLKGKLAVAVQRAVNTNVPYIPWITGYLALLVGALMTIVVQSSSVFTSAMTPLIAIGMISLERAYPLTLGSNLGTTTTAMLAALTAEGPNLRWSIQLALCHFLFNLTGILIFYPIPFMRFPIRMARALGRVTAKYRWFAVFYLIFAFVLLPLIVFFLSLIGPIAFYIVSSVFAVIFVLANFLNFMQGYAPERLPVAFRDWNFLPLYLHSLEPYDKLVQKGLAFARQTCCFVCCTSASAESKDIIKMKNSKSTSGSGLDNLGFVRGDQIDEVKDKSSSSTASSHSKSTPAVVVPSGLGVIVMKQDDNVEQTQL